MTSFAISGLRKRRSRVGQELRSDGRNHVRVSGSWSGSRQQDTAAGFSGDRTDKPDPYSLVGLSLPCWETLPIRKAVNASTIGRSVSQSADVCAQRLPFKHPEQERMCFQSADPAGDRTEESVADSIGINLNRLIDSVARTVR